MGHVERETIFSSAQVFNKPKSLKILKRCEDFNTVHLFGQIAVNVVIVESVVEIKCIVDIIHTANQNFGCVPCQYMPVHGFI